MSYRSLRDHGQARRPQPRHRGNPHRGGEGLALGWTAVGHTAVATQWVYDFAEGSRDMRELLGGKGANVAEMTRVLGTVLNLGLNARWVQGLARATSNERFAWDSYRRFVQMFGNVVHGIEGD